MTKRQMLAECARLAPGFRLAFERDGDSDTDSIVARWVDADGPVVIGMVLGPIGRAAVEMAVLERALGRLRKKAA